MSYFDDPKNVSQYIQMADGYDGKELIQALKGLVPPGNRVLELGMGPGKDLTLLAEAGYRVTGSDYSQSFLDYVKQNLPETPLLLLDAIQLETEETFNIIYSNKVLHQFSLEELTTSLNNQADRLETGGWLFHSFWAGSGTETFGGQTSYYFQPSDIETLLKPRFSVKASQHYAEMSENDSFWIAAQLN